MSRVWYIGQLITRSDIDITDAGRFGQLCPIFTRTSPYQISLLQTEVLMEILPNANIEDYVLLAGPTSMQATLISLWFQKFQYIRFLIWDGGKGRYQERYLDNRVVR